MSEQESSKTKDESLRNPHRHKWASAYPPIVFNRSPRFVVLSVLVHSALVAGVIHFTAQALNEPKMETVTIELSDNIGPEALADGKPHVPETQGAAGAPAPAPVVSASLNNETPDDSPAIATPTAPAPVVAKSTPQETPKPVPPAPPAPKPAAAAPKAVSKAVAPAPVAKPAAPTPMPRPAAPAPTSQATLDDVETPELDDNDTQIATVKTLKNDLHDSELNKDFEKADQNHMQAAAALQNELEQDQKAMHDEEEQAARALAEENKRQEAVIAQAVAARKAHAAKIAKEADEMKAAQQAARDQEAAEKAAAATALASAAGKTTQEGEGSGTGPQGPGQGASGALAPGPTAGVPGGVRTIDQLRQMPGNPRPAYSETERAAQQQGDVIYMAYIGRDGLPTQFKQTRSTGHANLDTKTLAALKNWKFYPGQEGWVEIPFRWDLRGGPQESSALARRKLSQKSAESSSY